MKKILLLFIAIFCFACHNDVKSPISENTDHFKTWVFRSVVDGIPRMITAQLEDDFYVSYNTQNGALYKAWKGIISMEGAVYDGAHGPQPTAIGDAYIKHDANHNPWYYIEGDKIIEAVINYKGHRVGNDGFQLLYEISHPKKSGISSISEDISSEVSESGQLIFKRSFAVEKSTNGPQLYWKGNAIVVDKIMMEISESAISKEKEIIDYRGKLYENQEVTIPISDAKENYLNIKLNKATILDPNLDDGFDSDDASLPIGAQLIGKHDCRSCHNSLKKTIGPAYISVAKKYEHNEENIVMLAGKIKKGGAGVWGEQVMTPHPEIEDYDLKEMIKYVFSLADYEGVSKKERGDQVSTFPSSAVDGEAMIPGCITKIYSIPPNTPSMPQNLKGKTPIMGGIMPNFDNVNGGDFKELEDNFALISNGYLYIEEEGTYDIRLWSDDGSKAYLHGQLIIDHDGLHGTSMKEAKIKLQSGYHPFEIEFFQGGGGKFLSFNYKKATSGTWQVIPSSMISHLQEEQESIDNLVLPMSIVSETPGDREWLVDMHPSFTLSQARPAAFEPKVGGMDLLPDGRLVVSTWDEEGGIYMLDNVSSDNPKEITYKKIAQGLAEPLGVKVVDGRIFVMQKQEITELIDNDGDDITDEYRTLCDSWGVTNNFHEFGFGLAEKDGYLYATLATGIMPGGAGMIGQHPDRGSCIKVSIADGSMEIVAKGLRTPNGIGIGYNGDIYIADNQGDWLPASKIVHVQKGDWFGSRAVDFEGTASYKEKKPVVWLPQDEIGNSPSMPLSLNVGPYKNQMIHGEVTHGGVKRVYVEEVNGELQGCVFRFMQGMEAGVNRLVWSPNGKTLYAGGIGNPGNWQQTGKQWFGLQKMTYNDTPTFEMLAVRAKSDGVEIEFTQALQSGDGWSADDYEIKQWYYEPTADYGGPKLDEKTLTIKSANVSDDRKKVFLELDGMKENHVVYVRLKNHFVSDEDQSLWSTEGWYTMNQIPSNNPGTKSKNAFVKLPNTITEEEQAEGWKLLFDGKSLENFHAFKSDKTPEKWEIEGDAIFFNPKGEGEGGDIVTNDIYEDFELNLEWKIYNCGNSGIFFNVIEDDKYCCTWQTGPEMQILDNTCHPDTKYSTHRAGDLYDMIECSHVTVKPAKQWNKIRLISKDQKYEFWLNGYKVVEFEMGNEKWTEMIADSKFKDMPDFGLSKSGHIALQDHGDRVWFRNIKIKPL